MFSSSQKKRQVTLAVLSALSVTAAWMQSTTAIAALGDPVNGQIQVCIEDPKGLASYTVNTTMGPTTGPAPIGISAVVPPASMVIKVGTCAVVATSNVSGGFTEFSISLVLAGAQLQAVSCINLNGTGTRPAPDCAGPDVILDVNFYHGSVVKYHVLPKELVTPGPAPAVVSQLNAKDQHEKKH